MPLQSGTLLAEVHRLLSESKYAIREDSDEVLRLPRERCLLAEDRYGVVAVAVYDTWSELAEDWTNVQAALVEEMSIRLDPAEPKAWDGYLVLLTPSQAPRDSEGISSITHDTGRLRKLGASGENLSTLSDVERAILPLMPIDARPVHTSGMALLDSLPELLARRGVARSDSEAVVQAFRTRQPLVEALHENDATS